MNKGVGKVFLITGLIAILSFSFVSAGFGDLFSSLFGKDLALGPGDDIPVADTSRIIKTASFLKNNSCTDYDGGIYSTIKGAVSIQARQDVISGALIGDHALSEKFYYDRCVKNRTKEYFCGVNGTLKYAYVNCTIGCDANGLMCKTDTPQPTTCIDSDGGRVYDVNGTAIGLFGGQNSSFPDSCCQGDGCNFNTGDRVLESYCDGSYIRTETALCPNGCMDGECNSIAKQFCIDSDNGKNYTALGKVTTRGTLQGNLSNPYVIVKYDDVCNRRGSGPGYGDVTECNGDGCVLIENSCNGNSYDFEYHTCENGCFNGTCVIKT